MTTLKERLSQKIATAAEYDNLIHPYLSSNDHYALQQDSHIRKVGEGAAPFWAKREVLRIRHGIYEVSEQLTRINILFPVYAHVSTNDKKLVAYTDDRQGGMEDRQRPMAPGRFFSKLFPLHNDAAIKEMTEHHLAETCMEVEFLYGEDIVAAYTSKETIGSCMAGKDEGTWNIHPAVAYMQPNIAMAVARNSDGAIIARSMVFMPTPKDKRWIRGYGHPSLIKRLERDGFKKGSFAGAKLNTVALLPGKRFSEVDFKAFKSEGRIALVVPYLDANGGMADSFGSTVALVDNELRVLNQAQYYAVKGLGDRYCQLGNTVGYVGLKPVSTTEHQFVDALTGVTANALFLEEDEKVYTLYINGQMRKTVANLYYLDDLDKTDWLPEYQGVELIRTWQREIANKVECVKMPKANLWVINTPEKLQEAGYVALDLGLYPELEYVSNSESVRTQNEKLIRKSDAVLVASEENTKQVYHPSEVPAGLIRLYGKSSWGGPIFAHPKAAWVRVGSSRLKVHRVTHDIVELFDGTLAFARGKKNMTLGSRVIWFDSKTTKMSELSRSATVETAILETIDHSVAGGVKTPGDLFYAFSRLVTSPHAFVNLGEAGAAADAWLAQIGRTAVSFNTLREYLVNGRNVPPTTLVRAMWHKGMTYSEGRFLAGSQTAMFVSVFKRLGYAMFDEALAEEAPHYLVDLPTERTNLTPLTETALEAAPEIENVL